MTVAGDGDWESRAARVIPGGASTGSKRSEALYGRQHGTAPTHFVRASGCSVETATGHVLTDFTCPWERSHLATPILM